jgi:hypothetical protein
MSRRHSAEKREVLPDPRFNDVVLTKFMNNLMYDGKKSAAEQIVYGALEELEKKAANDKSDETESEDHHVRWYGCHAQRPAHVPQSIEKRGSAS